MKWFCEMSNKDRQDMTYDGIENAPWLDYFECAKMVGDVYKKGQK